MWLANTGMVERVVERVVGAAPAAVLVAGDFLYSSSPDPAEQVQDAFDLLAPIIEARIPTFALLGNHDYEVGASQELTAALEAAGIDVLLNDSAVIPTPPGMRGEAFSYLGLSEAEEVVADGFAPAAYGADGNGMYVTCGIGFSLLPMRINAPPLALADGTSRDVLLLLADGERTAGEVAAAFDGLTRQAVSHHLRRLTATGLAVERRDGRSTPRWPRSLADLVGEPTPVAPPSPRCPTGRFSRRHTDTCAGR